MLLGKIPEGNNAPLFYLLQKIFTSLLGYEYPHPWAHEWHVYEPKGQVVLRVLSNFFMCLAFILIFLYMVRCSSSIGLGVYAIVLALSLSNVWLHWIEARPYALWFLLTAIQTILLARISKEKMMDGRSWWRLGVVHYLLGLTISFSAVQIAIALFFLWLGKHGSFKKFFWTGLLPIAIAAYYFSQGPKYPFWFAGSPILLIYPNFHKEWLIMLNVYGIYLVLSRKIKSSENFSALYLMVYAMLAFAFLGIFKIFDKGGPQGFLIPSRYFFFLVPPAIIWIALISWDMLRKITSRWLRANVMIVLLALLTVHLFRTAGHLYSLAIFWRLEDFLR